MTESNVIAAVEGRAGRLTLNRPEALNALTLPMCRALADALIAWRDDPAVEVVIVDHGTPRGFCAGGDVRLASTSGPVYAHALFLAEYRLNHLMFGYPKPLVAFMDGVTMGGGVGLATPCSARIATERTLWAMPETALGFFVDVGMTWRLARLPGFVGTWLALTGARLGAADCLRLGFATALAASADLPTLKARLAEEGASAVPAPSASTAPIDNADEIAATFGADTVEGVLHALEKSGSAWATAQRDVLLTRSPLSLKVTLRLLRDAGQRGDFAGQMAQEFSLAVRFAASAEFRAGVRAVLVDRDPAPRWPSGGLAEVDETILGELFAPLPEGQGWTPLAANP